jgi:hypothetical protein
MKPKKQYQDLVDRLMSADRPDMRVTKMYGMLVLAYRGKAFIGFNNDCLVVRLMGSDPLRA